jgi:hypothetical protein
MILADIKKCIIKGTFILIDTYLLFCFHAWKRYLTGTKDIVQYHGGARDQTYWYAFHKNHKKIKQNIQKTRKAVLLIRIHYIGTDRNPEVRILRLRKKYFTTNIFSISVADLDPDPGSGAFWPLDPGSGIGFFRIQDLGSRIPIPYF